MLATTHELVDGKRLRASQLGDGPPLLLLHGYPDTLQIWSELAPRLAHRFRVTAFDWPGMGGSDAWDGELTPEDLARRVVRLLDHWQLDRATLVAHDIGGQAALAAAILAPERIASLVVMNTLAFPDEPTSLDIALLRRIGLNGLLLRHLPRSVFRRAVATSADRLPRALCDELWQQFARRDAREVIVRLCGAYQRALPDLAARYASIRVPTTILWAGRDHHFPLAHAHRLHSTIRGSRLTIIENANHWMAFERAEEVAAALTPWLAR